MALDDPNMARGGLGLVESTSIATPLLLALLPTLALLALLSLSIPFKLSLAPESTLMGRSSGDSLGGEPPNSSRISPTLDSSSLVD